MKKELPFIIFFDDGHSYWKNGVRLKSVSYFLKKVINDFEAKYWETHSAFKAHFEDEYMDHFRYLIKSGMPDAEELYPPFMDKLSDKEFFDLKKAIRDKWEYKKVVAGWKGSKFHKKMELKYYRMGEVKNPFTNKVFPVRKHKKSYDNQSLATDLSTLEDGCYLELLVFDPTRLICGQADVVFIETVGNKRYIDIDDFKTNEKKPTKSSRGKMKDPLSHMGDNKHNRYVIQVNLYAKLLSQHGLIPRHLAYTWYENYNEKLSHIQKFPYLEPEMNALYDYFF
jgi:hypothetical protein